MSFVHCTNGTFFVSGQFHSGISQQSDHGLLVFVISRRIPPKKRKENTKMLQPCQDNYSTTFASYDGMRRYHEKESLESRWHRCRVNELHIEPLDKASPLYGTPSAFAAGIKIPPHSGGYFSFGHSPNNTSGAQVRIKRLPACAYYLLPVNGSRGSNILNWSASLSLFSWSAMYSVIAFVFFPTVST